MSLQAESSTNVSENGYVWYFFFLHMSFISILQVLVDATAHSAHGILI
jgi:hypothetical protein